MPVWCQTMTGERMFDDAAISDAAESLIVQIDLLLDRAAGRLLNTPTPGSDSWRTQWNSRDGEDGRARADRHLHARTAIAQAAGLATFSADGWHFAPAPRRRRSRSNRYAEDQLALFL